MGNGELANPPVFVTDLSSWEEGLTFSAGGSRAARRFRILAILPFTEDDEGEVREQFDAIWVVEPVAA
jgi:hypothetical protein